MPAAVPADVRMVIWELVQAGRSHAAIAQATQVPYWTVRRLARAAARTAGPPPTAYARCAHPGPRVDRRIVRRVRWLKHRHPTWGAGYVQTILRERYPDVPAPSIRSIQRWWRAAGLTPPPAEPSQHPPAQPPVPRATAAHQVWQLDAVDQAQLANGDGVSWLTITDEASGAILSVTPFPPPVLESGAGGGCAGGDPDDDDDVGHAGHHPGR